MPSAKDTGDAAELRALAEVKRAGLRCLSVNYRGRFGEIDIVARDKDTVVFIEVRARKNALFGSATESVTSSKQRKILRTAQQYLQEHQLADRCPVRFDVIGITGNTIHWIKNAFQ